MMRAAVNAMLGSVALVAGGGCAGKAPVPPTSEPATSAVVTGSVTYRERIALPPSAVVIVRVADVSRADAAATVLGEQRIEAAGRQVPFTYAVPVDPARIEANHEYAVQVRIEDGGRLLFISDQRHPVLTRGAPASADIVLKAVGARSGS